MDVYYAIVNNLARPSIDPRREENLACKDCPAKLTNYSECRMSEDLHLLNFQPIVRALSENGLPKCHSGIMKAKELMEAGKARLQLVNDDADKVNEAVDEYIKKMYDDFAGKPERVIK